MPTQRFVARNGGTLSDTVPATVSTGVGTAGQIVALNSSGLIDTSMLQGKCIIDVLITATISTGLLTTLTSSTTVITVQGAVVGQHGVIITPITDPGSLVGYTAFVSAANTVTIRLTNYGLSSTSSSAKYLIGLVSIT